jgi:predicted Zn-dependent protease
MKVYAAKYNSGENASVFNAKVRATIKYVIVEVFNQDDVLLYTRFWLHETIERDEFTEGVVKLVHKSNGKQSSIEVDMEFLDDLNLVYPEAPYLNGFYAKLFGYSTKLVVGAAFGVVAVLVLAWNFFLPLMINVIVSMIPVEKEIEMGNAYLTQFSQMNAFAIDTTKSVYLDEFYTGLHLKSQYPVKLWYVNNDIKNAFALPGGNIVVFSGLLKEITTSEQLAALIGHENGHVIKRHSMQHLVSEIGISAIVSLLTGSDKFSSTVLNQIGNIGEMANSREKEEESDRFAFELLKQEKLNPEGLIQLFGKLKNDHDQGTITIPDFLQTHPNIDTRIKTVRARITAEKYDHRLNPTLDSIFVKLKSSL